MHNHRKTDWVEYYSDAVLAIAATLLVTELHKSEGNTDLLQTIASQWPAYAAFAASFLFICIAWTNHHNMYKYIRQNDQHPLLLNIFFFAVNYVTVIHNRVTGPLYKQARRVNGSFDLSCNTGIDKLIVQCRLVLAIKAKGLLEKGTDLGLVRVLTIEYTIALALHLVAFIICLWSVPLSIVPIVLLSPILPYQG